jgi:hypothetical protein
VSYPEDIGRATSGPLDEVRTVLSRARTALRYLGTDPSKIRWHTQFPKPIFSQERDRDISWTDGRGVRHERWTYSHLGYTEAETIEHPGAAEMIHGLQECIRLLEQFERTGKIKYRG